MRPITFILALTALLFGLHLRVAAQKDTPIHPSITGHGTFHGITPPLRDLPLLSAKEFAELTRKAKHRNEEKEEMNEGLGRRSYPFAATALPKGPDPVWQQEMGNYGAPLAPIQNFSGQTSPYYPPDANGCAGPNHYMQTINCVYAIYTKTGGLVASGNMNTLFSGVTGSSYNDGDPIVLYDEQAGRWLATEFSISGSNDYMLMAVSSTSDPTGTWYKYSFDVADLPDYPKFGVWQDGYYMADNNSSGNDIYVFQRSVMLTGGASPSFVGFDNSWRPTTVDGFMCVPPIDNDGPAAPTGSPALFITINDDAIAGGSDQLWIYELAVNWTTPSSSTFTRSQQLAVPSFDSNFGNNWDNITQPNTQKLDAIPMIIMNVPQYRNFGSYQTIVCCHTVDVDATNHAGIRWYELRKTTGSWSVRQSGTYAPDANNRWMGSVMLNGNSQIGLGYSVSSSSIYPSIRYCGQSQTAYAAASGAMDITESSIQVGTTAQSGINRWGDYSQMSVDPSDDRTFWFTTQYGGSQQTKIAAFKFSNEPTTVTQAATSVGTGTATLNGTINPNGLASTYYFQYGTTTSYGSTTTTTSAGSGSAAVAVNAAISGLTYGTTYHFRLVGTNSDGTSYGSDLTFTTTGAATVTTTAASSVSMNSATAGGNVTSDGGFTVTARGVCWSTSLNPTISNDHTTDGSGTGTFTSSLTGLSSSTTYHIRAYATNQAGTYYGDDLTFTTLCNIITTFPWNEGFENSGSIPACWTQEQVNSSGINWVFITGNGGSNPASAHTGTYNACLKDVTTADNITRLISPTLDLSGVAGPQLTFWHTQASWSGRQDQLYVYYRTSATGTWTLIQSYTASVTAWTQRTLTLPEPSSTYYICFQGNAKYGRGVCIDDIQVTGTCGTTYAVSVSIVASSNPVCAGNSVTFTATPTNGGTTPAYQWKVNGSNVSGATNNTYSYAPANNDAVACVLTSNASCVTGNPATSNTVTMTTTALSPVSVAISPSANNICAGTSVTFTAVPTNGGTTPGYQWEVNGTQVNGATNSTYSYLPLNNDAVTCVLTSNAACATNNPAVSNTVSMVVNSALPVSVSITASLNPSCWSNLVNFTATPGNGGASPAYQWKVNGNAVPGATNAAYTFVPVNNDAITCVLTSSLTCTSGNPATSNAIIMTVLPLAMANVSIAASANPACAGAEVTFTATPENGGTPSYEWYRNDELAGTAGTYSCIPSNGDRIYVIMLSSNPCASNNPATSNEIHMTVDPIVPVSLSIEASANPVDEGAQVTFTATPANGGSSPGYQWKVNNANAGTNSSTFSYVPADGDQVSCVVTSNATCVSGNPATSNTIVMQVNTVPQTLGLQGITVTGTQCFNAQGTIEVAGGGTTFTVANGGNAKMLAGYMIIYYPGTTVQPGGEMYGYIVPTGPWCNLPAPMPELTEGIGAGLEKGQFFSIYPNPTTGEFMLEITGLAKPEKCRIEIFDMRGAKVLHRELPEGPKHELSLAGNPPGIYLVRVIGSDQTGTTRLIKRN